MESKLEITFSDLEEFVKVEGVDVVTVEDRERGEKRER